MTDEEHTQRVGHLGESILRLLDTEARKHGPPSFETVSIHIDALVGVAIALTQTTPTSAAEMALRERFVDLFQASKPKHQ